METRSLSTIKNNTVVLSSFSLENQCFDIRDLSFRKERTILIITSSNLKDNTINATKVAPVAELIFTSSNKLRFSCKPSMNYPSLKSMENLILSAIQSSL